jgi:hypothetical protein
VEKYVPFMTDKEKKIIGYLLKYNQKTFTAAAGSIAIITCFATLRCLFAE